MNPTTDSSLRLIMVGILVDRDRASTATNDLVLMTKVLVKVVAFEGKHKIADRWEEEPYVFMRQMNNNIPVYEVKKLHGKGKKRILHRNLLLPIGHLQVFDTDHKEKKKEKPNRLHQKQDTRADTNTHLEDEYHSDTDSDSGTIIGEVPAPHQTDHIPSDVQESVGEEEEVSDNGEPEVDGSVDQEESTSENRFITRSWIRWRHWFGE